MLNNKVINVISGVTRVLDDHKDVIQRILRKRLTNGMRGIEYLIAESLDDSCIYIQTIQEEDSNELIMELIVEDSAFEDSHTLVMEYRYMAPNSVLSDLWGYANLVEEVLEGVLSRHGIVVQDRYSEATEEGIQRICEDGVLVLAPYIDDFEEEDE